MTTSKRSCCNFGAFRHDATSENEDTSTIDRICESLLRIYASVNKLKKDSRIREQTKLADIERLVKVLEGVIFSFEKPLAEATPVLTPARTTNLNSRVKGRHPTSKTSRKNSRKTQGPSKNQGSVESQCSMSIKHKWKN
ncbi:hypothetical protein EV1_033762 [Malus domestica]